MIGPPATDIVTSLPACQLAQLAASGPGLGQCDYQLPAAGAEAVGGDTAGVLPAVGHTRPGHHRQQLSHQTMEFNLKQINKRN